MTEQELKRFMAKVFVNEETGCWEWTGGLTDQGYVRIQINKKREYGHRIFYRHFVGEIPEGLELDHLCRNRSCLNPKHLDPVTHQENCKRGIVGKCGAARMLAKTHCPQGHEYNKENTYVGKSGKRHCRICKNKSWMRLYYKKKMTRNAP